MARTARDHGLEPDELHFSPAYLLGAQAGLYYHYGIDKVLYPSKLFGVEQAVTHFHPLVRGFDDVFYTPHSRYTGIDEGQLAQTPLEILAAGVETGPSIFVSEDHKNAFLLGHF